MEDEVSMHGWRRWRLDLETLFDDVDRDEKDARHRLGAKASSEVCDKAHE